MTQLIVLAGPNGAGKSTFYHHFLSSSKLPFLNADLLAAETQVDSFEAARVIDATRAQNIAKGIGFITETVFSDPMGAKLGMLRDAIAAGFDVTLIYIGVSEDEMLAERIDQRVARGGHDVPRDRIKTRFLRSLQNLKAALAFVPTVVIFDNSEAEDPYRLVARFENGEIVKRGSGAVPAWLRGIVPAARKRKS